MNKISKWKAVWTTVIGTALSWLPMNEALADGLTDAFNKATAVLQQADQKLRQAGVQQGHGSAQQTATANDNTVASADESSASGTGSAGTGPDVLGLRIGASPAVVRGVIKPRQSASTYAEVLSALSYTIPGVGTKPVEGSKFISEIRGWSNSPSGHSQRVYAKFLPEGGHEELIYIDRAETLSKSEVTTYATFEQSLIGKYGRPTQRADVSPPVFIWSFDRNGALRKPEDFKNTGACLETIGLAAAGNWPPQLGTENADTVTKGVAACGDIVLRIQLDVAGSGGVTPAALVTGYGTTLVGLDATVRGERQEQSMIDAARGKANNEVLKAASQQKPDL